jgi:uncharacterized protein YbcV (DUF1398 family)
MDAEQVRGISSKAKQEKWKFPLKFIALKDAGVNTYRFDIDTGYSFYEGKDGTSFSEPHPEVEHDDIAPSVNAELITIAIKRLASEQLAFCDFCNEAAKAGVLYWKVEIDKGICTYFGKDGSRHVEYIPV